MPTASAISAIVAPWYPRSLKTLVAAAMMSARTGDSDVRLGLPVVDRHVCVIPSRNLAKRSVAPSGTCTPADVYA